jgi:hypothetical protein
MRDRVIPAKAGIQVLHLSQNTISLLGHITVFLFRLVGFLVG